MRKLFLILFLFIAIPVSGAVSYSRTPDGTLITSPVSLFISANSWQDYVDFDPALDEMAYYKIEMQDNLENWYNGGCFATTNLTINPIFNLPVETEINTIIMSGWTDDSPDCSNEDYQFGSYVYETGSPIFTIISGGGVVPSLFSMPMASSSDMVASVGTLFTDLWVIIALTIGVPLAFYIVNRFIGLTPKDKAR